MRISHVFIRGPSDVQDRNEMLALLVEPIVC